MISRLFSNTFIERALFVKQQRQSVALNDNVSQDAFITKANKLLTDLKYSLYTDGLCCPLSNTYIKYASMHQRNHFFKMLKLESSNNLNNNCTDEELKSFFTDLNRINNNYSVYLDDRKCFEAFSFISSNSSELETNISNIVDVFKKRQQHIYAHITLGNTHSFVMEQYFESSQFIYYIYDPNNKKEPRILLTAIDIANEINFVMQRNKLSDLEYRYLFNDDFELLLTFYVYLDKIQAEDGLSDIYTSLIKTNPELLKIEEFNYISLLVKRYEQHSISRNIVLINLLIFLEKLQTYKLQFKVEEEKSWVKNELSAHILSMNFLPIQSNKHLLTCFKHDANMGKITLLHEVARIGDVQAVQALMFHTSPLTECNDKMIVTPLDCALSEAQLSVIKIMINYMETINKQSINVEKYNLDYSIIRRKSFRFSQAYSSSNSVNRFSNDCMRSSLSKSISMVTNYQKPKERLLSNAACTKWLIEKLNSQKQISIGVTHSATFDTNYRQALIGRVSSDPCVCAHGLYEQLIQADSEIPDDSKVKRSSICL